MTESGLLDYGPFGLAVLLVIVGAVVSIGSSIVQHANESGIHKGRMVLAGIIGVVTIVAVLHVFSTDFRFWFNAQLGYWWQSAPAVDILILLLLLTGVGAWAFKTWRQP